MKNESLFVFGLCAFGIACVVVALIGLGSTTTAMVPVPSYAHGYFESYMPSGVFLGIANEVDPYSGRPFLAYKIPGQPTTTDRTRVAPRINPEVAQVTPRNTFTNER